MSLAPHIDRQSYHQRSHVMCERHERKMIIKLLFSELKYFYAKISKMHDCFKECRDRDEKTG